MGPLLPEPAQLKYIAWYPEENSYLNLAGIYNYLEFSYFASQDYENSNLPIHPTCAEMLDAYIPPLFLEKAALAGLDIPDHYISNGYFEPPVIIDPVNPFSIKSRVVLKNGRENHIAKSMTRNYTYAICCQEIPKGCRIIRFRSVLGWCMVKKYREISSALWKLFKIPLARIRILVNPMDQFLVSDISPLLFEDLNPRERNYLEERIQWQK